MIAVKTTGRGAVALPVLVLGFLVSSCAPGDDGPEVPNDSGPGADDAGPGDGGPHVPSGPPIVVSGNYNGDDFAYECHTQDATDNGAIACDADDPIFSMTCVGTEPGVGGAMGVLRILVSVEPTAGPGTYDYLGVTRPIGVGIHENNDVYDNVTNQSPNATQNTIIVEEMEQFQFVKGSFTATWQQDPGDPDRMWGAVSGDFDFLCHTPQ